MFWTFYGFQGILVILEYNGHYSDLLSIFPLKKIILLVRITKVSKNR